MDTLLNPGFLSTLGTLLFVSTCDTLEALRDTLRCYYRPCVVSFENWGPVSLRRWATPPQTSVRTYHVPQSLLEARSLSLNLEYLEVAGRYRTPT